MDLIAQDDVGTFEILGVKNFSILEDTIYVEFLNGKDGKYKAKLIEGETIKS